MSEPAPKYRGSQFGQRIQRPGEEPVPTKPVEDAKQTTTEQPKPVEKAEKAKPNKHFKLFKHSKHDKPQTQEQLLDEIIQRSFHTLTPLLMKIFFELDGSAGRTRAAQLRLRAQLSTSTDEANEFLVEAERELSDVRRTEDLVQSGLKQFQASFDAVFAEVSKKLDEIEEKNKELDAKKRLEQYRQDVFAIFDSLKVADWTSSKIAAFRLFGDTPLYLPARDELPTGLQRVIPNEIRIKDWVNFSPQTRARLHAHYGLRADEDIDGIFDHLEE